MDNHYIAGFVDGEGSFHVAFQKRIDVTLKWQAIPEFRINQHASSKYVLEGIQKHLACGNIKVNHRLREDDHTYVLVVRNRKDLLNQVIPFFERYPLHTQKKNDLAIFQKVVKLMDQQAHLTPDGFTKIVHLAYSMNASGYRRRAPKTEILQTLKSSETIRQKPVYVG